MQDMQKTKTVYMRVLANGNGYQLYDFKENRCHENAFEILKNFSGVVHSDKYGAYETLAQKKEIIWSPCWSHIRRKFFESETDPPFRDWMLRKIRYLGSQNGGKSAAVLFSLVQTCRSLKIDPQEYLEDIMRRIMDHNSQKLFELLPDQWLLKRQGHF